MLLKKTFVLIIFWYGFSYAHAESHSVAIATAHPLATDAGLEIIKQGGNIFDAAVAVSAALAVVEPAGSGLGGGGYWLLRGAADNQKHTPAFEVMLDGRETAPLAAHAKMYLDGNGKVIPKLSTDGALAAAIPGMPAALVHLSEKYGRLSLQQSLAPAIRYAKFGFAIGHRHHRLLKARFDLIKQYPSSSRTFLFNGELPNPFSVLKQPDLAETLQRLAAAGHKGFYQGETAHKLLRNVKQAGGIWSQQDLDAYKVIEREPIHGNYRGIRITSAAPSSSGGIVLMEALNILSGYDLSQTDPTTRKHFIVEAMRRAYHDRALYLGDPSFTDIPVTRLLSTDYAAGLRASINTEKALPSQLLSGENQPQSEGTNTTHFSIIDSQGNCVAATLSINFPFGSGMVADGTGVVLNNEMDDFSAQAGEKNGYGLVGGTANAIAPGKRMLSSMTPTFLETPDRLAALGTPGGSRIISMVLLATLDFSENHLPDSWVSLPRFHHQFLPDTIEYEANAFSSTELLALQSKGHQSKMVSSSYGDMQAVLFDKNQHQLFAASDPRGEGRAFVYH